MAMTEILTPSSFELVTLDLYRDIHKAIRAELFAVTGSAGRIDPADDADIAALAGHLDAVVEMLVSHAHHEDVHIQPAVVTHLPDLAEQIEQDHAVLEGRMADLRDWARTAGDGAGSSRRGDVHRLYVELASFTSAYLAHQDIEERVVMPELERAVGVDAVAAIHTAIVTSIPPAEMATSLSVMIPAMNVEDRVELLGGMQSGAPPEVFDGVWSLVGSLLEPYEFAALGRRLGR